MAFEYMINVVVMAVFVICQLAMYVMAEPKPLPGDDDDKTTAVRS